MEHDRKNEVLENEKCDDDDVLDSFDVRFSMSPEGKFECLIKFATSSTDSSCDGIVKGISWSLEGVLAIAMNVFPAIKMNGYWLTYI